MDTYFQKNKQTSIQRNILRPTNKMKDKVVDMINELPL